MRRKRRKLAGAALKAHLKKIGRKKRRKVSRRTARRGANARRISRGGSVAKRKRRRSSSRRHIRRRRRSTTRVAHRGHEVVRRRRRAVMRHRRRRRGGLLRNPALSISSLKNQAIEGVKGGAGVLLGEAGTNIIAGFIPVAKTGIVGYLVKGAAAVATGFVVHKAAGPNLARYALAGGFASILRAPLKALQIPLLSSNLGDAGGAYSALGAYPMAGLGAGPTPGDVDSGMGGYADMGYGDDGMGAYPMN